MNLNTEFETTFTVLPKHTNYMYPLIFGGSFFSEIDLCAASCVNRFLHASETCNSAVTHKAETTFAKPCYCGDLIFLKAKVNSVSKKSIVVTVSAQRERRGVAGRDHVGTTKFVFISIGKNADELMDSKPDMLPYAEHGIKFG